MLYILFALIAAVLLACSDNASSGHVEPNSVYEGMLDVYASGHSVDLGTNISLARNDERPAMKASFTYNFMIGKHEVTCSEFNALSEKLKVECENDSMPAFNVNYFDAVLFANARSKSEKLDTAYTFGSATFDGEGHCTSLEGLKFLPEVDAYRLPTEAEWVYVASKGWDAAAGWNDENSDMKVHAVCSRLDSLSQACDMAGNLKEWVNDWKGIFKDTSVINYLGAPLGNSLGERILKGGCFHDAPAAITLHGRGDSYVVGSVTRANYVGFRLAFGKIPDPTWMNGVDNGTTTVVSPLLNSNSIRSLTGTVQVKLVFRNDVSGNLSFIDYSKGSRNVVEIQDTLDAYHPDVSPDGNWVAFCTGIEGSPTSKTSKVYVRRLNENGSDLVKLDVESAAIPRFRITPEGDTAIVYVTSADVNNDEAEFKKQSTWQVVFSKGQFGVPQKLFDGGYNGGVNSKGTLAVTGARLLRAKIAYDGKSVRDTVWYNGEQACNVSLSKDGLNRTLFLDFGGKTGKDFVGEKYGVHRQLLIADSTGKLIQNVPAPSGYSFDHSEWTSKKNLAVVTLTNANDAHEKIALVNVDDGSVVDLVASDELWHPTLWIDNPVVVNSKLDLDSAGVYQLEDDSWGGILMRYNMELLWRYYNDVDVAILGSSRPLYSISPAYLNKNFFAVNFAHTPNSIYASRDFLNRYLFNHLKKLKYVVVSLDIDFWWKIDGPESDNFFETAFYERPGYVYDASHDYWVNGINEGLANASANALGVENSELYLGDRGRYLGVAPCASWGNPEVDIDSILPGEKTFLANAMNALVDIVKEAGKRDVMVIGMIFPINPSYQKTGAFGRYGLRRSVAKKLIEDFENLSKEHSNFILMDENKMGNHDYVDSMAVDTDHLCENGVSQISSRLNKLLLELKNEK